ERADRHGEVEIDTGMPRAAQDGVAHGAADEHGVARAGGDDGTQERGGGARQGVESEDGHAAWDGGGAMVRDAAGFRDLAYVFVAAVLGAFVARLAHQPLILGYVAAGIVISPLTPGPSVSDLHTFEVFAEIGVVLLMFSIGIEFSLRDLLRVKRAAF